MRPRRNWLLLTIAVLGSLVLALGPVAALANGETLSANLSYLPEVSTWGATDATGTAAVNVGEGHIELAVRGLPMLSGEVYEAWLVTGGLAQWVSIGRFTPDAGPVSYVADVDEIPELPYAYLVITVEPAEGDTGEPSGRNIVGGAFGGQGVASAAEAEAAVATPGAAEATAGAAGTAAPGAEATATPQPPAYLPVSGAAAPRFAAIGVAGLVLVAAGSVVVTRRR